MGDPGPVMTVCTGDAGLPGTPLSQGESAPAHLCVAARGLRHSKSNPARNRAYLALCSVTTVVQKPELLAKLSSLMPSSSVPSDLAWKVPPAPTSKMNPFPTAGKPREREP